MPGHGRGGVRSGPPRVHTPTGPGTHVHTPTGPGTQPPAGPAGSTPFKVDVPVGHALDLDFDIAVKQTFPKDETIATVEPFTGTPNPA